MARFRLRFKSICKSNGDVRGQLCRHPPVAAKFRPVQTGFNATPIGLRYAAMKTPTLVLAIASFVVAAKDGAQAVKKGSKEFAQAVKGQTTQSERAD